LKEHLLKREENANYLKTVFAPTKRIEVGWTHINIDEVNRTFTIPLNICGDTKNPPVFKFEELQGYEILEEYTPIERFNRGDVSPLCTPMMYNPVIQFGFDDKDDKAELINRSFTLNLYLTNPCWDKVESSAGSASGHERDFHRDYINHLNTLRPVSAALVGIIGSNVSGNVAQSNVGSISDDLIKFKELLDAGIINQDEFDIKKKQLLGL